MNILTPRKALNKAFLKQKVYREEMERFKTNLLKMLHDKNENESEEYHKNLLSAFLKETWYKDLHFINTRERTDLVIHEKAASDSAPAVLIETKKPGNKSEMPSKEDLNAKALHELIRYYLHERVDNENKFIKHLIVTDLNAFFIFDENEFDKYVYGNRQVLKDYEEYKNSGKGTDFFYNQVARPLVADIGDKLTFTCFEVKEFQRYLKNGDPEKEKKLIPYYKLLAPEHLLKKPFANDSNTLDRHFYNELLHIIGLKEVKQGSQKLIQRAPEAERQPGSLVENAINILQSEDIIGYFKQKEQYGSDRDEQAFNIALELVITWINRILFLKLLEAQLVRYHRGDAAYKFLNIDTLPDYDALNKLFFQVLAVEPGERNDNVREHYSKVPYLNSSLFEPNELERNTIRISNLEDEFELPYLGHTVLKDNKGKRRSGKEDTLRYLFEFLEAYDFASEGSEDIQEENKNLINASVLGLIFEKINGYRDGSFFTPGFITEYMARETIRRAVVQKFNEAKGWQLDDFEALKEKIEPDAEGRAEANRIINSLKVVDPAVGSGHFLVSALNEIIALKSELKVLSYRSGDRIKLYQARVENDELIVEDHEEGGIFEYNLSRSHTPVPEKQALQEALFHEKQTIIENCLFGVDINPNSVKICRLRLWIELLKNAYYQIPEQKTPTANRLELQTLPNIDINIKAGNSLVSRFPLDASLESALKQSGWRIQDYKAFVKGYKHPKSKEDKISNLAVINEIKKAFSTAITRNHPKQKQLDKLGKELYDKYTGERLFEEKLTQKQKKDREWLEKRINKLQEEIDELKNSEIYRNAFEWRFEFPEVLDDEGNFKGFDVVIGNPPYILVQSMGDKAIFNYYAQNYKTATYKIDTYTLFYELGIRLLSYNSALCYITPNTFLKNKHSNQLRRLLLKYSINEIINFYTQVFEDASVDTLILFLTKKSDRKKDHKILYGPYRNPENDLNEIRKIEHTQKEFEHGDYVLELDIDPKAKTILSKIEEKSQPLKYFGRSYFGIQTYNRKKHVSNEKINDSYYPVIDGGHIKRYSLLPTSYFVEFTKESIKSGGEPTVYSKNRIVVRQIGIYPEGTIVEPNLMTLNTIYNIFLHNENIIFLRFLLGIINSKLIHFYWYKKHYDNKATFPKIKKQPLESLPIFDTSQDIIKEISHLVKTVLETKQTESSIDTGDIENEIDQIVYELYGLTDEEIDIVGRSVD